MYTVRAMMNERKRSLPPRACVQSVTLSPFHADGAICNRLCARPAQSANLFQAQIWAAVLIFISELVISNNVDNV